ncbi:hypothetical protein NEPAR04_0334 [Nematocida parisii]|nr:hypothetical protein NEPAR03_0076 [Nematocida parisii]KAI5125525.1 hypothetical protein NEPAR08_0076 [Nematocida parisii]KAI5140593.1 hypothetical protein NEPAR04_0334 [Nematocida parisii]
MNLRFSIDALQMLIDFKASKDIYPSRELMTLFSDLLPITSDSCLPSFLAECAYEYFYCSKQEGVPTREEFLEWTKNWMESTSARILRISLPRDKSVADEAGTHSITTGKQEKNFLIIDSKEISKNSPVHKSRREFIQNLKNRQKETDPSIKRVRMSMSEDILEARKEVLKITRTPKPRIKDVPIESSKSIKSNLLFFMTKRSTECTDKASNLFIKYPGIFYGNISTIRRCKEISIPTRMVFYQIHGQIRPPFYAVKDSKNALNPAHTRNSCRKILPEEEYLYDSEEEWVEEDGESIDKDSSESDEEESEDAEWVEKDTNELFFGKGQLPRIDYPVFTVRMVDEAKVE